MSSSKNKAARYFIIGVVIGSFIVGALSSCMQVDSNSMSPTLQTGDYLILERVFVSGSELTHALFAIRRGDIIVFRRSPRLPASFTDGDFVVKRVVGLPGDKLYIAHGVLVVNGKSVVEPYVKWSNAFARSHCSWPLLGSESERDGILVPADSFFVLGDRREDSVDSRIFGSVGREAVVGRVLFSFHIDPPSFEWLGTQRNKLALGPQPGQLSAPR